ncbi:beta-phosphoglucomutase [Clostridium aquiflavi]|uniref:Beta-phosphoglucomutase n=1 Tax=Clostridium aquiflavi TaxID=3073603 RepID=A0ABU1EIW0_9CLOT|nr:beta-phosphoglucomutase [Clostridium sp. 5N-1]MDR5588098.1 beta-phosphoglucomutase [Clostridium sp. 5N-1]
MLIKGVIFDLDGVITDTAEGHYKAWEKLADEIGVSISREFNEGLKGLSREDSLELILKQNNKSSNYTNDEKINLLDKKNKYYLNWISNLSKEDILPGVVVLLKKLKNADIKIGLASASKNAPLILEKLDLTSLFDIIANPELVSKGKPDPGIFLLAAKELNLQTKNCVGIEDSSAGIKAINDAGMYSIGVGNFDYLKEANCNVNSLIEIDLKNIL